MKKLEASTNKSEFRGEVWGPTGERLISWRENETNLIPKLFQFVAADALHSVTIAPVVSLCQCNCNALLM